jgi:hypothetical protein
MEIDLPDAIRRDWGAIEIHFLRWPDDEKGFSLSSRSISREDCFFLSGVCPCRPA